MFCFHDRLKQFTFKDGTTIKMCPDCTQFDNKRRETLLAGRVELPKSKDEMHFGLLLEKAGLDVDNDGLDGWLNTVGDSAAVDRVNQLTELKHRGIVNLPPEMFSVIGDGLRQLLTLVNGFRTKPTLVDDSEWIDRQQPFAHSQAMPRRYNSYCTHCVDVVVDGKRNKVRTTKGVYLPIAHDCAAVRVYSLSGVLIEVKVI